MKLEGHKTSVIIEVLYAKIHTHNIHSQQNLEEAFKKCYIQEHYRVISLLMACNLIAPWVESVICQSLSSELVETCLTS